MLCTLNMCYKKALLISQPNSLPHLYAHFNGLKTNSIISMNFFSNQKSHGTKTATFSRKKSAWVGIGTVNRIEIVITNALFSGHPKIFQLNIFEKKAWKRKFTSLFSGHPTRPLPSLTIGGLIEEVLEDVQHSITPYLTCPDLRVTLYRHIQFSTVQRFWLGLFHKKAPKHYKIWSLL